MMQNNNIEQETICFQITWELGRFPGNHDYHVTYDPRCRCLLYTSDAADD